MAADSLSRMHSARWCLEKLQSCTDPALAAELRFLAKSLMQQAQPKPFQARAERIATIVFKEAA